MLSPLPPTFLRSGRVRAPVQEQTSGFQAPEVGPTKDAHGVQRAEACAAKTERQRGRCLPGQLI